MAKTDQSAKKAKLLAIISAAPDGVSASDLWRATGTDSLWFGREYGEAFKALQREGEIKGHGTFRRGVVWRRPPKHKKFGKARSDFNRHKIYMGREVK